MDATDRSILRTLMQDGRATWADLAVELGLTAPAIAQRVRRLQERGIIRHFAAVAAPELLAPVSAFVRLAAVDPSFRDAIRELDWVQECHQTTGDYDYLLKVRCQSLAHLGDLVSTVLPRLSGGGRISSTVILASLKESTVLPIPDGEDARNADA
jgi:Lrp/AsnC family leucine-responsive transcriptional regulator